MQPLQLTSVIACLQQLLNTFDTFRLPVSSCMYPCCDGPCQWRGYLLHACTWTAHPCCDARCADGCWRRLRLQVCLEFAKLRWVQLELLFPAWGLQPLALDLWVWR